MKKYFVKRIIKSNVTYKNHHLDGISFPISDNNRIFCSLDLIHSNTRRRWTQTNVPKVFMHSDCTRTILNNSLSARIDRFRNRKKPHIRIRDKPISLVMYERLDKLFEKSSI